MPEDLLAPSRADQLFAAQRDAQDAGLFPVKQQQADAQFGYQGEDLSEEESLGMQFAMAVPRGLEGMLQGVYKFADFVSFDALPDWNERLLGRSTNWAPALLEGLATYALPGTLAVKAFGVAQKGVGFASMMSRLGRGAAAGAVVDAVITDPDGGRLSDWAKDAGVDWAVTDFLATDPNDSEAEARLKNALEGIVPGLALDGIAEAFRAVRNLRNGVKGVDVEAAGKAVNKGTAALWKEDFGFDHDEVAAAEAFIDMAGLDRSKIRRAATGTVGDLASEERAYVRFEEDGRAYIGALKNPDVTSATHELAHVARRQLFSDTGVAARIGMDSMDIDIAADWAGATKKGAGWDWSVKAEEKFASGVERYMRDGTAPTKKLESFFSKMATYFRRTYTRLTGTALDLDVSPEMKKVFDKMFQRGQDATRRKTSVRAVTSTPVGTASLVIRESTPIGKSDVFLYSADGDLRMVGPSSAAVVDEGLPLRQVPGSVEDRISRASKDATFLYKGEIDSNRVLSVKQGSKPTAKQLSEIDAWVEEGSGKLNIVSDVDVRRVGVSAAKSGDVSKARPRGINKALAADEDILFQSGRRDDVRRTVTDDQIINPNTFSDEIEIRKMARGIYDGAIYEYEVQGFKDFREMAVQATEDINDAQGAATSFEYVKALTERSVEEIELISKKTFLARQTLHEKGQDIYKRIKDISPDLSLKGATDEDLVGVLALGEELELMTLAVREVMTANARALGVFRIRPGGKLRVEGGTRIPDSMRPGTAVDAPAPRAPGPGVEVPPAGRPTGGPAVATDGAGEALGSGNPRKRRIPKPEDVPDSSHIALIRAFGGRKKVEKMIRQIAIQIETNPDALVSVRPQSGWFSMVPEAFINSILSGPITHATNLTGGVFSTVVRPLEMALGALLTGNQSLARKEVAVLANHVTGSIRALKVASASFKDNAPILIKEGGAILEHTPNAFSDAARGMDPTSVQARVMKHLGKIVNLPSRFLMAEDEMIKQLNYQSRFSVSLTEMSFSKFKEPEARAQWVEEMLKASGDDGQFYSMQALANRGKTLADRNGLSGVENDEFVTKYAREMWDGEAHKAAVDARQAARESTYTEDFGVKRGDLGITKRALGFSVRDGLSDVSAKLAQATQGHPSLRLIFPFVRTPVNLLQWFNQRTLGVVSDLAGAISSSEIRKAYTPEMKADLAGRWATGSALLATAAHFASLKDENGLPKLTGAGPSDPNERKMWEATGWRPYSIRVGDRYISYRRIDPAATFFGIVADLVQEGAYSEMLNREPEWGNALMVAVTNNMVSKTYLLGAVNLARAIGEPERFAPQLIESFAGAAAPFSSFVNQAINPLKGDDLMHEIRGAGEAFRSKWILSNPNNLPLRRNVLGETIERDKGALFGDSISPLRYTMVKDDALAEEMVRSGAGISPPRSTSNGVDWKKYTDDKGTNAYDRWMELQGTVKLGNLTLRQRLEKTIKSKGYTRLPQTGVDDIDSPRVAILRRIVSRYREKAKRQAFDEFPELSSDARKILTAKSMLHRRQ